VYASINERVERIKGNEEEINRFVEEYKPFIASCTRKLTGKYAAYGESDELSIALIAFIESIDSFNLSKGNFLSFAQNVIRRRLIDYYRKEKKHMNVISLNGYYGEESGEEIVLSEKKALDKYTMNEVNEYRRLEIEEIKNELRKWDITFDDLARCSPKHSDTREVCKRVIRLITSRTDLIECIRIKKYLPVADIEKNLRISRKKFERFRKYVIAVVIIITGDYQYVREYLEGYLND
jgi:RNA polymerase sigma factor